MEYTTEPFDVREINFSINDYSDDWFEFDVFRNDLYNVIIKFQSENFNKSGLPAIFSAEKSKEDNYVHDNWFAFNIDSRGVGHGHWAAINDAFDKYIHKLWREDKYTLEGRQFYGYAIMLCLTVLQLMYTVLREKLKNEKMFMYITIPFEC